MVHFIVDASHSISVPVVVFFYSSRQLVFFLWCSCMSTTPKPVPEAPWRTKSSEAVRKKNTECLWDVENQQYRLLGCFFSSNGYSQGGKVGFEVVGSMLIDDFDLVLAKTRTLAGVLEAWILKQSCPCPEEQLGGILRVIPSWWVPGAGWSGLVLLPILSTQHHTPSTWSGIDNVPFGHTYNMAQWQRLLIPQRALPWLHTHTHTPGPEPGKPTNRGAPADWSM